MICHEVVVWELRVGALVQLVWDEIRYMGMSLETFTDNNYRGRIVEHYTDQRGPRWKVERVNGFMEGVIFHADDVPGALARWDGQP